MTEKPALVPTSSGCLGWLLGLIGVKIVFESPKLASGKVELKSTLKHEAITGENLRYTHPELVPSQPQYVEKQGGKNDRVYTAHDLRG